MKFFLPLLVVLLACSCGETVKIDETDPGTISIKTEKPKPSGRITQVIVESLPDDTSLVTVISEPAAIFTLPDTSLIKDMIEEEGAEDFYTEIDNAFYKQDSAARYLEEKGLKVIYPKTRYLHLTGGEENFYLDTQKSEKLPWISIFYSPGKAPEVFNPLRVEKEYKNYFEKEL